MIKVSCYVGSSITYGLNTYPEDWNSCYSHAAP